MQVEIFALCDAATEAGGKLNFLGSFDTIFAKEIPFVYNAFSVVLKIRRFDDEMRKDYALTVEVLDPNDNAAINTFEAKMIKVPKEVITDKSANAHFLINYQNFEFKHSGHYKVRLSVGNELSMDYPLYIKLAEKK